MKTSKFKKFKRHTSMSYRMHVAPSYTRPRRTRCRQNDHAIAWRAIAGPAKKHGMLHTDDVHVCARATRRGSEPPSQQKDTSKNATAKITGNISPVARHSSKAAPAATTSAPGGVRIPSTLSSPTPLPGRRRCGLAAGCGATCASRPARRRAPTNAGFCDGGQRSAAGDTVADCAASHGPVGR